MNAAANAPIAVASSSNTPNIKTSTIYPNSSKSDGHQIHPNSPLDNHQTNAHPSNWVINPVMPNNIPIFPQNRPINSVSNLSSMPSFPPNRPINSAPANIKRITMASAPIDVGNRINNPRSDHNTQNLSPRRRRNNGEQNAQSPRNAQNRQNSPRNAPNPRNAQNQNVQSPRNVSKQPNAQSQQIQETQPSRILVTGYPTYTQPHDLLEVFTKFGNVRIDKCNGWSATLTYPTDEQAKSAIASNKRLHIYGHFLSVRPYSAKLKSEENPQSPKRDFSKSKQKNMIIEPIKLDLSGDFHAQMDIIMAAIRLNQDDINRISSLYRDLENAFQAHWPGCKAIPFGSITTGLGIRTSDADCFINLPPHYRQPHGNHVNKARKLLANYPQTFAEILAIPRANTPIVKFYHVPTETNCDLTFKTPLGAQNSRLIAFLLHADPRITPMAVMIKYWAKVHELSGTGKLTNYALTMMIIFYLQQPPMSLLPSVEWLQRDRNNDIYVDFWNTGFMNNSQYLPPTSTPATISEMLGGFFEYYSIFNFEEMVVCPFLGVPVKKEAFADTQSLPPEFSLYKKNVLNNLVMPIRHQTSICVQDPFEQCHNVASTITSKLALDIKTFFKFAANAYEKEKLNNCAGFLKTILIEKPKLIRGKTHPEYRVNLFPRIINTIISFDWKPVVRTLVVTIFENMMKIKLGKVEEKVNPDTRKEKEKYMGSLSKPIWKRKKYNNLFSNMQDLGIEEKQSMISEELLKNEVTPVSLQFQLTLTFCHDPKSAVLSIKMGGGDLDAFREFGKFFISVMQSWFTQLLKPYSMPNCKDTAAKIAETVEGDGNNVNEEDSDDDEHEIILTPSTTPAQDKEATTDKTSENSSTDTDETPPVGATETKDACEQK